MKAVQGYGDECRGHNDPEALHVLFRVMVNAGTLVPPQWARIRRDSRRGSCGPHTPAFELLHVLPWSSTITATQTNGRPQVASGGIGKSPDVPNRTSIRALEILVGSIAAFCKCALSISP